MSDSDSEEDGPKSVKCPVKLARWLSLRFGLLGLREHIKDECEKDGSLKKAKRAVKGLDIEELELLRRFILRVKESDPEDLEKGVGSACLAIWPACSPSARLIVLNSPSFPAYRVQGDPSPEDPGRGCVQHTLIPDLPVTASRGAYVAALTEQTWVFPLTVDKKSKEKHLIKAVSDKAALHRFLGLCVVLVKAQHGWYSEQGACPTCYLWRTVLAFQIWPPRLLLAIHAWACRWDPYFETPSVVVLMPRVGEEEGHFRCRNRPRGARNLPDGRGAPLRAASVSTAREMRQLPRHPPQ